MAKRKDGGTAEKFTPVPVIQRPASAQDVEAHLREFVAHFVQARTRHRWEQCLLASPEKASNQLQRFHQDLDPDHCRVVVGNQGFPAQLAAVYGDQLGVYFDGGPDALLLTAAEAATLAAEGRDALLSFVPGKSALCFDHDGGTWACKR